MPLPPAGPSLEDVARLTTVVRTPISQTFQSSTASYFDSSDSDSDSSNSDFTSILAPGAASPPSVWKTTGVTEPAAVHSLPRAMKRVPVDPPLPVEGGQGGGKNAAEVRRSAFDVTSL